jgi:integral membrane protein (TIGR01906 family)
MIVLLSPVTHALADRTVNDQLGGFTHEELVALADSGLAYVTLGGGDPLPIGEDEYEAFTPEVIAHLDDVRTVLRAAMLLTVALTLAVAAMLIVLIRRGMGARALAPVLAVAGLAPLVCVLLLAIISMVSFDAVFATMHQLFFSEGTWTFAWDSLLIRIYPLTFWMGMGIVWAVALVFFSVLSLAIGLKLRKV